jgi:hypothetical protein
MQASMMRAGTGARPDKIDATHAFSRSPLSRPYRPFAGPIFNGSNGSRLCENSCACSRGPILFAFSSPQSIQKQENREEFRSARPAAENRRVFAQPRSIPGLQAPIQAGAKCQVEDVAKGCLYIPHWASRRTLSCVAPKSTRTD